jgi:hypothetical protein
MNEAHVNECAMRAHEANRAYCTSVGDDSQPSWAEAPEWQKDSAVVGVRATLEDSGMTPEKSHEGWLAHKEADGWKYGEVKDPEKKEHPCYVPYAELPADQQVKDSIFLSVVRSTYALLTASA